jgi:hypothetical protein
MAATPLLTPTPLETQIEKFDINCGGLTIQQAVNVIGQLIASGTVSSSTTAKQSDAAPSSFTVQTAAATVFTLAAGEIGFIQNLDDAALAVKLGVSASTSSFSLILQAGDAADDGRGGLILIDNHIGVVSVAPMSGTARYIAWKKAI